MQLKNKSVLCQLEYVIPEQSLPWPSTSSRAIVLGDFINISVYLQSKPRMREENEFEFAVQVSIQYWAVPQLEESQFYPQAGSQGDIPGTGQDPVLQLERRAGHRGGTSAPSAAETKIYRSEVFISPPSLAASPGAAALKHSGFAWGSCREQSLWGAAMRDKSFGAGGEDETKARSWNHRDPNGMSPWILPGMSPVSNHSLELPFSFPMAASCCCPAPGSRGGTFPPGRGVQWPHQPGRKSWASPREEELAQGSFPTRKELTRASPHLQHWHEFLTPLFTQARLAFSPTHCTGCAILGGEILD